MERVRPTVAKQFRLLGAVELHDEVTGTGTAPSGSKQRALFCAFALHPGRPLSAGRLTEELWGDRPPHHAANALQAHVARLRRLLSGTDTGAGAHAWISTLPAGYLLRSGCATTDIEQFHELSAQGRAAVFADPPEAVRLLSHALALWRGPALQDSRLGPLCTSEADRLEEHRLTALESLYEASLRCARHRQITGELEKLTLDHPLRERFYDLLMAALHRSGRQAEALGVYERARRQLVAGLGVEPGPALRARMEAVLHQSRDLSTPPGAFPHSRPSSPAQPREVGEEIVRLRRRVQELTGTQEQLMSRYDALAAQLRRSCPQEAAVTAVRRAG
ncbi:BTAD domain-containing putative transcriptional regulator [Streptomyces albidoflavus]